MTDIIKEIAAEVKKIQELYQKAYAEGYDQGKKDILLLIERKLRE